MLTERTLVAIESPYAGNVEKNLEFARNICRYALANGKNPYAMHLFFPQLMSDNIPSERKLGIECGLAWTNQAQEVWFCLRPDEKISNGMQVAIDEFEKNRKNRQNAYYYLFEQDGTFLGEWKP